MMQLEQLLSPSLYKKANLDGFTTLESVLWRFPLRYEDIKSKDPNTWIKGDKIYVEGRVLDVQTRRIRKNLSITNFLLQSNTGLYQVSLFNRPWLKNESHITLYARFDGSNKLTAINYNSRTLNSQLGIHPVYSRFQNLSSKDHQKILNLAFTKMDELELNDLPQIYKEKYKLLDLKQALRWMHHPLSFEHLKQANRSLKYEEFLRFQLKMVLNRSLNLGMDLGRIKVFDRRVIEDWKQKLPFTLSSQQNHVLDQLLNDLQSSKRMYRLLQGDVGSGKTVLAALAMYATVLAHYQTALLAPTEILAYQHLETLRSYLPESVRIEVLSASKSSQARKEILQALLCGDIDILIGTHSLISDDLVFKNIGLVVVDEQHRFGVNQRRKMADKGDNVDFLLMSATPIPRTLASVVFGDLDVSTITEYHSSKAEVITKVIHQNSIAPILSDLLSFIKDKQQIYVVCPSIEENEESDAKSVNSIYKALRKVLPKEISIDYLHGKLKSSEKDDVMHRFTHQKTDILVTTTVIEVGVNVKSANIMVIYDADRFGLSQLHQLRGRVGRGEETGYCFLLSDTEDELSLKRLEVLEHNNNGFEIANKDLELRGPGEIFGLKQSGIPSFLVANLVLDAKILEVAKEDAFEIVKNKHIKENQNYIENIQKQLSLESID